jgi:hypothetical protein
VSQRSPAQRSAAQSTGDAWPAPIVGRGHRIVSGAPTVLELQRSSAPEKEGDQLRTVYSDCPVCHSTEGKDSLPCWSSTAPSCLGTIKGTPRHMEESPKLTRNILRLQDSNFTHSICWYSDLSSIWVVNSVHCVLISSCDLCAWLCCGFESCVCCSPHPYFCASFVIIIVRARGSKLWRFLANGGKTMKGKNRGIQVDHQITWKGLSATLVHWDATTWK